VREVSDITCLTFPEGSVLLCGEYERLFEEHLRATITLPPGKVASFLRQAILSQGESSDTRRYVEDEPWPEWDPVRWPLGVWKPDSARHFSSGQAAYGGYLAVWSWLIDLDDPNKPIFYLVFWDKGPASPRAALAQFRAETGTRSAGPRKALPGADVETPE
jgi:hypothetical protein